MGVLSGQQAPPGRSGTKTRAVPEPWEEGSSPVGTSLCWVQVHLPEDLGLRSSTGCRLQAPTSQCLLVKAQGSDRGREDSAPPPHEGCISAYGCLVPETFQVINK